MDPFSLIENAWWTGVPAAFLMGLFLGANPAALPVLGVGLGLAGAGAGAPGRRRLRLLVPYALGLVLVYGLLGLGAGHIDSLMESFFRPRAGIAYLVLGLALVLLAILLLTRPDRVCSACTRPGAVKLTTGGLLLGVPAGLVNCPACAGIVTGVAASSAALGNPVYSTVVMLSMGLGHLVVVVGAATWLTKEWAGVGKKLLLAQRLSAALLLAMACYFFLQAWSSGFSGGQRLV